MLWRGIDEAARNLLGGATASALVVAPFIKEAAIIGLLEAVGPGIRLEVYTRWRDDEVASGVSDTAVLDVVRARGGTLGLIDELHAKVVAADLARCLVGSANVTAAGLGTGSQPNLEVMHRVDDAPGSLALFAAELRARARGATEEERLAVEGRAAVLRDAPVVVRPPKTDAPAKDRRPAPWLPRFRSPDRLFRLYSDVEWLVSAKPGDPALADLLHLGIPGDLGREAFTAQVRHALLASAGARLFDRLLDEPRRFGALSGALAEIMPGSAHAQRQAAAQTLVRWLMCFAPDLYRIDTPNYSEVLSKR